MKILHLIYTRGISGAEKYLLDLLPGLKEYGIECELMLVSPGKFSQQLESYCRSMEALGVKTIRLSAFRTGFISAAWKINRYLRKNDIRYMHSHLFNTDLLVALVKQFFHKRIFIISSKHGYSEKVLKRYTGDKAKISHDLYYFITRYTLGRIDENLSISNGISNLYYNLKLSKTHYPVIPHGINISSNTGMDDKELYRKGPQQLIIVGRLEEFKGHRYLIDALPEVIKLFPGLQLLILGEGSQKTVLKQQAEDLRVSENVMFLGFKDDPYSFIASSDIIILPSLFEPFGLVYIESFALRVPVIAFDTPAGNEIIVHNETGILVPRGDSNAIARNIIFLLQNEGERTRLSENAYRRYLDFYNTARMIKDTAAYYRKLPLR